MTRARRLSRLLPCFALLAGGCAGQVITPPDATHAQSCVDAVASEAAVLDVTSVKSGVFIGDTLHLEAKVGGVDRYLVVRFAEDGAAYALAAPDALTGPANLVTVGAGRHARVRVSAPGTAHLDVIDTSNPASPALVETHALGVAADPPDVFSAADGHVYFCARPEPDGQRQLTAVDVSVPGAPAAPQSVSGFTCYLQPDGKLAAAGDTWIAWNLPTGNWAQQTNVRTVAPSGDTAVVDYAYNQTGVHMYGNVLRAATDGARAVFDPENASLFLLADVTTGPNPFTWATFDVGSKRSLLGVAGAIAYLTTPSGVRAYDIDDIWAPELLPYHAKIAFDGVARLVATSETHLLVADDGDSLYLVPREGPGNVEVAPLVLHEGPPPAKPAGCTG